MKKNWALSFVLVLALLLAGCGTIFDLPSVCDDKTERSVLCDLADSTGIKLEDIGRSLIFVNAVAIHEGEYTKEQAIDALKEIRQVIDNPVSYLFFKTELEKSFAKVPGLFEVTEDYINNFVNPQIMHDKDREILMAFLDNRIDELEDGSIISMILGWFK